VAVNVTGQVIDPNFVTKGTPIIEYPQVRSNLALNHQSFFFPLILEAKEC